MKLLKISIFLFLISIFNISMALEAPSNINLDKAGEDFLEISWDKIDGAGVYSISYGEKSISGTTDTYEHEEEVVVETNSGKVENLKANTSYYIAIKAYDDNEQSSDFSKEVKFKTTKELEGLKVENVEILNKKSIELKFNINLKKDSLVDLNITNKDTNENIEIENYEINNTNLKVLLQNNLETNTKYSIVVVALEGEKGETINAGINGNIDFTTPEILNDENIEENEKEELNSAGVEKEEENNDTTENKPQETENNNPKIIGGKVLDNTAVTTEKVAKEIKKMPQTGPAQTALFLIFAFIASALFFILRRKINN